MGPWYNGSLGIMGPSIIRVKKNPSTLPNRLMIRQLGSVGGGFFCAPVERHFIYIVSNCPGSFVVAFQT